MSNRNMTESQWKTYNFMMKTREETKVYATIWEINAYMGRAKGSTSSTYQALYSMEKKGAVNRYRRGTRKVWLPVPGFVDEQAPPLFVKTTKVSSFQAMKNRVVRHV